ncbi:MAG: thioredoxin domain-containing protein [Candidatus Kerfeldbacteria bacterium]
MDKTVSARIVYGIGVLSVIALLVILGFAGNSWRSQEAERLAEEGNVISADSILQDPLITVVPEEVRGGVAQPLEEDPKRGNDAASVQLIEFGNYESAESGQIQEVISRLLQEYPDDVRHVWKDFPVPTVNPNSETAAMAARCAEEQGAFWQYHDILYANQSSFADSPWLDFAGQMGLDEDAFDKCLAMQTTKRRVLRGYYTAKMLEFETAPAFYINSRRLPGVQTYEELKDAITNELNSDNEATDE